MNSSIMQERQYHSKIHPKKFALWLGLGSILMMFAGLTSAVIVRHAQGDWVGYRVPDVFLWSTGVILLSSVVMQLAYRSLKKGNVRNYKIGLAVTLLLGLLFAGLQLMGWETLKSYGIRLQGNPSGSFLYIISGVHLLHLIGGLFFLIILFFKSFRKVDIVKDLIKNLNPEKYLQTELMLTYWHFVGVLWVYLYVFLRYFSS